MLPYFCAPILRKMITKCGEDADNGGIVLKNESRIEVPEQRKLRVGIFDILSNGQSLIYDPSRNEKKNFFNFFLSQTEFLSIVKRVNSTIEVILKGDIQISVVTSVGSDRDDTRDGFAFVDGNRVFEVKDGLFPVSICRIGSRSEYNVFVAFREFNVKIGNKGVDVIVSGRRNFESARPSQILNFDSMNIHRHYLRRSRGYRLSIYCVDERLQDGLLFYARHVKTVHVVPVYSKRIGFS